MNQKKDEETFIQRWKSRTLDFFFEVWLYEELLNHVMGKHNVEHICICKLNVDKEGVFGG